MKLDLLIFLVFLVFLPGSYSFLVTPDNFQKCGLDESMGIILCIAPVTSLFQDNLNLENITRARGIRIVDECRNATTCLTKFPCVTGIQLDKIFSLMCDAISYFSTDFAPCMKKVDAQRPPCIRELERTIRKDDNVGPCELETKYMPCFKTEITDICGEEYWTPIEKILTKMHRYSQLKCPNISY